MHQDDRDAIARVVFMWRNSVLAVERTLAANLNAVLDATPEHPVRADIFRPTDEPYLLQAAGARPAKAADLLRAAAIVHQLRSVAG